MTITEDTFNKLIDLLNKETELLEPMIETSVRLQDEEEYDHTVTRLYQSGYVDGIETALQILREDLIQDAELV